MLYSNRRDYISYKRDEEEVLRFLVGWPTFHHDGTKSAPKSTKKLAELVIESWELMVLQASTL